MVANGIFSSTIIARIDCLQRHEFDFDISEIHEEKTNFPSKELSAPIDENPKISLETAKKVTNGSIAPRSQKRRIQEKAVCPECNKVLSNKYVLKQHQIIHSDDRPFTCSYENCGKRFIQRANLTLHQNTHTNPKPFACSEPNCGRRFTSMGSKKTHENLHKNIKPFECNLCEKSFAQRIQLQIHEGNHSKDRLHACTEPNCRKTFRNKYALKQHGKQVHERAELKRTPLEVLGVATIQRDGSE